jgi:hypothetical protein
MTQVRIAMVGHCRPDQFGLRSALGSMFPDAEFVAANTSKDARAEAASADLYLVNRALDGRFTEKDGNQLIENLFAGDPPKAAVLLVSNYADAQENAVKAGAHPGFGKQDLNTDEMRQLITDALAAHRTA